MNWNHPQVWIILAIVGLSFLQWVIQKIREQSAVNKAREAARRSKEESLRTGRVPEAQARDEREIQQARTALDEKQRQAIERRQEQLRELRRKQMEAQSRARAGGAGTATPSRQSPMPPPGRVPTPPPARPAQARPAQKPAQPAPQQPTPRRNMTQRTMTTAPGTLTETERITRQRQAEALRRQQMMRGAPAVAPAATPQPEEEPLRPSIARLTGLRGAKAITTPDAHAATTSGSDLLANLDADDWRRGIILSEILRDPVGLRDAFPSRVG